MSFINKFDFAPAEWLPLQDREMLDRVCMMDIREHQGRIYEHPDFEMKVVHDVHNYFATDLFHKIYMSDVQNQKLVMILPSPENAVFISLAENINKFQVSCRNVHIFFLYEYANENGDVAPWQSPYSRSGHFMRYFYQRVEEHLRMPMENIHFWTKENTETYSDELAALGGADVAYTALSWTGIGAIDPEAYPAETMEAFLAMGSRCVPLSLETATFDSMRGMFGCSGDIANVPPRAVTVGPKDLAAAKERVDVAYLTSCGGEHSHQKTALKLGLLGPVCPQNPASMMRLYPGLCLVDERIATPVHYYPDNDWVLDKLEEIRRKEAVK